MPGYYEHIISGTVSIQSISERNSRQCLHLKQVELNVVARRKRDREPSRVPCKVLKSLKQRKLISKLKAFQKKKNSARVICFIQHCN